MPPFTNIASTIVDTAYQNFCVFGYSVLLHSVPGNGGRRDARRNPGDQRMGLREKRDMCCISSFGSGRLLGRLSIVIVHQYWDTLARHRGTA